MDSIPSYLPDSLVSDLVGSFLEAAQHVASSSLRDGSSSLSSELTYELDQVVSQFLEDHALSPGEYDSIQQCVLDRISADLSEHSLSTSDQHTAQPADASHSGLADVMSLVDDHFSQSHELSSSSDSPDLGISDFLV